MSQTLKRPQAAASAVGKAACVFFGSVGGAAVMEPGAFARQVLSLICSQTRNQGQQEGSRWAQGLGIGEAGTGLPSSCTFFTPWELLF